MAHRIAELMERADQAQDDREREVARRACADLILRLWAHRADRPHGSPLTEIAAFLQVFADAPPARHQVPTGASEGTWINVLHGVMRLAEREEEICRAAAVAELSLDNEYQWLTEHRDELSEDEQSIMENLIQLQNRMRSEYFRLDDEYVPGFGTLTAEERTRLSLEQLQQITAERQRLFGEMANMDEVPGEVTLGKSAMEESDQHAISD